MQRDVGAATDSAYVTVVQEAPAAGTELENHSIPAEETVNPEQPPQLSEMELLAYQIARDLHQIHQAGDSFAAIAVHPELVEGFTAAFQTLPEEVVPVEIKEKLPIVPEDKVEGAQVITQTHLEHSFLMQRYGPREVGGNGFIQDLQGALARDKSPVRINLDFLRAYYLLDLAEKVRPRLYTPNGAEVLQTIGNLRR